MIHTFLNDVIRHKIQSIAKDWITEPITLLRKRIARLPRPKKLSAAILKGSGIIAEIKRRSPSKEFPRVRNIVSLAREYEKNGAAAISVLTDERYFGGSITDLQAVKAVVKAPVLRKDFIIDEYQIYQARAYGADAVLLIASILKKPQMKRLLRLAGSLGMEALVEVHNRPELNTALGLLKGGGIIGINNRNLATLKVDLETGRCLLPRLSGANMIKIMESGIKTKRQIKEFRRLGADGFLIGGALLNARLPGLKLKEMCYDKS